MKNVFPLLIVCSVLLMSCATPQTPTEKAQHHVSAGKRYMSSGNPETAKSEFLSAANLVPTNANTWGLAGVAARESGNLKEALQYFRKVTELNPNDARAYGDIGAIHAQLGNYDEGIASFEQVLKLNPQEFRAAAVLAEIYYGRRNFKTCEYYMNEFDSIVSRTRGDLLSDKTKQAIENLTRKFANYRTTMSK